MSPNPAEQIIYYQCKSCSSFLASTTKWARHLSKCFLENSSSNHRPIPAGFRIVTFTHPTVVISTDLDTSTYDDNPSKPSSPANLLEIDANQGPNETLVQQLPDSASKANHSQDSVGIEIKEDQGSNEEIRTLPGEENAILSFEEEAGPQSSKGGVKRKSAVVAATNICNQLKKASKKVNEKPSINANLPEIDANPDSNETLAQQPSASGGQAHHSHYSEGNNGIPSHPTRRKTSKMKPITEIIKAQGSKEEKRLLPDNEKAILTLEEELEPQSSNGGVKRKSAVVAATNICNQLKKASKKVNEKPSINVNLPEIDVNQGSNEKLAQQLPNIDGQAHHSQDSVGINGIPSHPTRKITSKKKQLTKIKKAQGSSEEISTLPDKEKAFLMLEEEAGPQSSNGGVKRKSAAVAATKICNQLKKANKKINENTSSNANLPEIDANKSSIGTLAQQLPNSNAQIHHSQDSVGYKGIQNHPIRRKTSKMKQLTEIKKAQSSDEEIRTLHDKEKSILTLEEEAEPQSSNGGLKRKSFAAATTDICNQLKKANKKINKNPSSSTNLPEIDANLDSNEACTYDMTFQDRKSTRSRPSLDEEKIHPQTNSTRGGNRMNKRLRKKQQNNIAALRYRQKKRQEVFAILAKKDKLQKVNGELTEEKEKTSKEIQFIRGLISDMLQCDTKKRIKIVSSPVNTTNSNF